MTVCQSLWNMLSHVVFTLCNNTEGLISLSPFYRQYNEEVRFQASSLWLKSPGLCWQSEEMRTFFPLDFLESASVIQCFSKQSHFNEAGFHKLISPLRVKMWICTAVYLVLFIHSSTFIECQCAINYLRTWEQNRKSSSHQELHVLVTSVGESPNSIDENNIQEYSEY